MHTSTRDKPTEPPYCTSPLDEVAPVGLVFHPLIKKKFVLEAASGWRLI